MWECKDVGVQRYKMRDTKMQERADVEVQRSGSAKLLKRKDAGAHRSGSANECKHKERKTKTI